MATTLKLVTGELVDITAKYPSNYWHTPSYAEMNYILNIRTNAANLRTLGRVDIDGNGTYVNGCFLLPDDWVLPVGVSMIITTADYTTNSYDLSDFATLGNAGLVFLPCDALRQGLTLIRLGNGGYYGTSNLNSRITFIAGGIYSQQSSAVLQSDGLSVRLCKQGSQFSVSATQKINFAPANLQYHCTQHVWRFAENSYDIIGADNANIDDNYNGWIDLFGYGTSGVNYSPTLHTTNNADYCQTNLNGTVNDWGYNKICVDSNPLDTRTKIYENKIRALEFSNI